MPTVHLSVRDLEPFYKLQQTSFEVGGILDVSPKGLERAGLVIGSKRAVNAKQLPDFTVLYHTHPSYPHAKDHYSAISKQIDYLQSNQCAIDMQGSGCKIQVDSLIQTVSDSDLSTFSDTCLNRKGHTMIIFAPEGTYVLQCRNNPKDLAKAKLSEISKKYLKTRNETIFAHVRELESELEGKNDSDYKPILLRFQKKLAKNVCDLINDTHPVLECKFFEWGKKVSFFLSKKDYIEPENDVFFSMASKK